MSWRLPSSFVLSWAAVQETGSSGDLPLGVMSVSGAVFVPSRSSSFTASAASSRKS